MPAPSSPATRLPALSRVVGRRLQSQLGRTGARRYRVALPQVAGWILLERRPALQLEAEREAERQAEHAAQLEVDMRGACAGHARGVEALALELRMDSSLITLRWGREAFTRFDPDQRWLWLRMRGASKVRRTPPQAWVTSVAALTFDEAKQLWSEALSELRSHR